MFSMLSLLFDLFVSLSFPNIATALEIVPAEITSAIIVRFSTSPSFNLPIIQVDPSHSPTVVVLERTLRCGLKVSATYTPVALHGPLFVTVIVNFILSVTLTTPDTLTYLFICRSTLATAVMFLIEA